MENAQNTGGKHNTAKIVLKNIRKIASVTLTVFLVVCVLIAVYAAINSKNGNGVMVGPYGIAVILTESMTPAIKAGSMIVIKNVPENQLVERDVITYRPIEGKSTLVTHRIVSVNTEDHAFITQGDANNIADSDPVHYDSIVGKVVLTVPILGYIVSYLKTPQGIVLFILFLALCSILGHLISAKKGKDRKKTNL